MVFARRSLFQASLGLSAAGVAFARGVDVAGEPVRAARLTPGQAGDTFTARSSDGLQIAVEAYGNPSHPALVLIHGLNQSRLSWDRQIRSALVDRFRIVTYDLRGHGDSDRPSDVEVYADAARWGDDLAAVIDAADLRRPVIAGWSLGGFVIGAYLAERGGDRLAGVNLINAVVGFEPSLFQPANSHGPAMAGDDFAARIRAKRDFLAACFAVPPPQEEFERMLVFNGLVPREVQLALGRFDSGTLARGFGSLRTPVLVTFGREDKLVGVPMVERTRELIPQAEVSWYDGIGHAPFYESAERYNSELSAFVLRAQAG